MPILTREDIIKRAPANWTFDEHSNSIFREYECSNFVAAVEFIRRIAPVAEMLDHHPDILLHSYKRVRVMLTTHSAGGVTDRDIILASQIDTLI
ncbi:MAG: 4a-hydroxytetrahydrobiopterin dehydratase [Bacteroidetes bacterium]|nr:4a-hydroxytetrahydrobiopterin dehydratase [Bacteroidota bacterium]